MTSTAQESADRITFLEAKIPEREEMIDRYGMGRWRYRYLQDLQELKKELLALKVEQGE